jgi:hypothetical protein
MRRGEEEEINVSAIVSEDVWAGRRQKRENHMIHPHTYTHICIRVLDSTGFIYTHPHIHIYIYI